MSIKCRIYGKFIFYKDFESNIAKTIQVAPNSELTLEQIEYLCKKCNHYTKQDLCYNNLLKENIMFL